MPERDALVVPSGLAEALDDPQRAATFVTSTG